MIGRWILASRPKTLVACVSPVMVGSALFFAKSNILLPFHIFLCLIFAALVQIGTNFANDYYDHQKGADTTERIGPKRFVSSNLISPKTMFFSTVVVLSIAFFVGLLLMEISGSSRLLLLIGVLSILCAFAYTGGPFPLAYNALGDVFVVVFFGYVAAGTTEYVLCRSVGMSWNPSWMIYPSVGLMINNLLVVNNYRDYEEDKITGKNTLIVLFGRRAGSLIYFSSVIFSTLLCPLLIEEAKYTLLLLPIGLFALMKLKNSKTSQDFNLALSLSALMVLFHCLLMTFGILA